LGISGVNARDIVRFFCHKIDKNYGFGCSFYILYPIFCENFEKNVKVSRNENFLKQTVIKQTKLSLVLVKTFIILSVMVVMSARESPTSMNRQDTHLRQSNILLANGQQNVDKDVFRIGVGD
jgi:hypothetical protein